MEYGIFHLVFVAKYGILHLVFVAKIRTEEAISDQNLMLGGYQFFNAALAGTGTQRLHLLHLHFRLDDY